MLRDFGLFISEFRRNFISTGSLAPSSPALTRAMLKPLRNRPARPIHVLEVGPGTGAMTFHILKNLRPGDTLHIYELNDRFHQHLSKRLQHPSARWPGVHLALYHQDIRGLCQACRYNYIISSLPFANFEAATVREIMDSYIAHLAPLGIISYFEYLLPHRVRLLMLKPHQRMRLKRLLIQLQHYVQRHQIQGHHVWWNFPPARARHLQPRAGPSD